MTGSPQSCKLDSVLNLKLKQNESIIDGSICSNISGISPCVTHQPRSSTPRSCVGEHQQKNLKRPGNEIDTTVSKVLKLCCSSEYNKNDLSISGSSNSNTVAEVEQNKSFIQKLFDDINPGMSGTSLEQTADGISLHCMQSMSCDDAFDIKCHSLQSSDASQLKNTTTPSLDDRNISVNETALTEKTLTPPKESIGFKVSDNSEKKACSGQTSYLTVDQTFSTTVNNHEEGLSIFVESDISSDAEEKTLLDSTFDEDSGSSVDDSDILDSPKPRNVTSVVCASSNSSGLSVLTALKAFAKADKNDANKSTSSVWSMLQSGKNLSSIENNDIIQTIIKRSDFIKTVVAQKVNAPVKNGPSRILPYPFVIAKYRTEGSMRDLKQHVKLIYSTTSDELNKNLSLTSYHHIIDTIKENLT